MITVTADTFPLAQTFTISRGSKTHAHVLTVRVSRGGVTGWAECVPYPRYGDTLERVVAQISALRLVVQHLVGRQRVLVTDEFAELGRVVIADGGVERTGSEA